MKTYVLIQTQPAAPNANLTEEIAALPGVQHAVRVEGPFDVVAEVDGHEESTREAIPRITGVGGVLRAIPLHVVGDEGDTTEARSWSAISAS